MKATLLNVGRSLLALYFFLPGIMKFIDWDRHVALMETHGMIMVPVLLALAGVLQVGASICLLMNHEMQNFVKNLGIFAGLLLLGAMNIGKSSEVNIVDDTA